MIKVMFVDKENLEDEIGKIKDIKWVTQNGNTYTIIYEYHEKKKIKVIDKAMLGI